MFLWIHNIVSACTTENTIDIVDTVEIDGFDKDPLGWSLDLVEHQLGEFSMAAVQANGVMEDISQVEVGKKALFVGIYDGQIGDLASRHLSDNLFPNLLFYIDKNKQNMSEAILRRLVAAMEEKFMLDCDYLYLGKPERAIVSSSCLFCIIWKGKLYMANVGDSRAVMGSLGPFGGLNVQQLVRDHNAGNKHIQEELRILHPDDPNIVMYNFDTWRVGGISEVSRCIGNAYLKRTPFTLRPSFKAPQVELASSDFSLPLLSAEPEIYSSVLKDTDKFIIFGSSGLWKLLTNEQAAKIVNTSPRDGIAKRLVRIAQEIAARKKNICYSELLKIPKGHDVSKGPSDSVERTRLNYHDDISVTVVFLDKNPEIYMSVTPPVMSSFRSFFDRALRSSFQYMTDAHE